MNRGVVKRLKPRAKIARLYVIAIKSYEQNYTDKNLFIHQIKRIRKIAKIYNLKDFEFDEKEIIKRVENEIR